jgi:hypothetical protein
MSSNHNPITDAPLIRRPTVCRLCGENFDPKILHKAQMIADNPGAKQKRLMKLVKPFMEHMSKQHPKHLMDAQLLGGEFAGMLTMGFFQCDEPELEASRDETRWKIHETTRRVIISDERVSERLELAFINAALLAGGQPEVRQLAQAPAAVRARSEAFMKSELAASIARTMTQMRDVLEERGRYQMPGTQAPEKPEKPAETPAGA